jgi:membrane protein required for colicin V production
VTGFDFTVLAILGCSAILGLIRGLLKELLSLIAYGAAFAAAIWWGPVVYIWLGPYVEASLARMGLAYAAVFILTLMGVGLVNATLAAVIRVTGLGAADHGLGGLFGLARGALVVLTLAALAAHTPLPQEPWWRGAMFAPAVEKAVKQVKSWLPPPLAARLP